MLKEILLVGAGGGAGSIVRYLVSLIFAKNQQYDTFPWGTFAVNIVGSFALGFILGTTDDVRWRLLLCVGFCGGFTTFSTFSREALNLFQNQQTLLALACIVLSFITGLAAVWLGITLSK